MLEWRDVEVQKDEGRKGGCFSRRSDSSRFLSKFGSRSRLLCGVKPTGVHAQGSLHHRNVHRQSKQRRGGNIKSHAQAGPVPIQYRVLGKATSGFSPCQK